MAKFNRLDIPATWERYWSKYPQGYTIMEALISWVSQVNHMTDNVNDWNNYLEDFVSTFDEKLSGTVKETIQEWIDDGVFQVIVSEALQWELDAFKVDTSNDLSNLNSNLQDKIDSNKIIADSNFTLVNGRLSWHDADLGSINSTLAEKASRADLDLKVSKDYVDSLVESLASGSPKGTFSTHAELQSTYPTGNANIYIVTDNASWYYWDNTSWVSGGVYQSMTIANKSIKGHHLSDEYDYKRELNELDDLNTILEAGIYFWFGDDRTPLNQPLPLRGLGVMRVTKAVGTFVFQEVWEYTSPHLVYSRSIQENPHANTRWSTPTDISNKYMAVIGDSISVPGIYQKEITDELNTYISNHAYAGAAMAIYGNDNPYDPFSFVERTVSIALPDHINHVFIFMGTNDFSNGIPLGERFSENPYEFRGAIRTGIKNLITRKPTIKLAFATPMFKATVSDLQFQDILVERNGIGLLLEDYIEAVIQVCGDMGIPVINTFKTANINRYNYGTYMSDLIHPNEAGQKRLGHLFANFLKSVF